MTGSPTAATSEMRMICAGGFKAAMEKLAPLFEAKTGIRLAITIGTPTDTRRLMSEGAPFDVAVVTRVSLNDAAASAFARGSRFSIAKSPVGMGVREVLTVPAIGSQAAFRTAIDTVGSIGLSDPKAGTNLANDILAAAEKIGLRSAIEAKARYINGPGFVIAKSVAAGEADAVMTLATEIIPAAGIRYLGSIPESMGLGTVFDAGIAKEKDAMEGPRLFMEFLRSPQASEIMRSTGLVAP